MINPDFLRLPNPQAHGGIFRAQSRLPFAGQIQKQTMITNSKQNCMTDLSASLRRTASWRRELCKKFPSDTRNGRAAEKLDQLASETNDLTDEAWLDLLQLGFWDLVGGCFGSVETR